MDSDIQPGSRPERSHRTAAQRELRYRARGAAQDAATEGREADAEAEAETRVAAPSVVPFVRASSLHIGAAAAAASLRRELVDDHGLTGSDVDRGYAVSRVTPGTNLLALYAVLGHRLGGWSLAVQAIIVGACVPAVIAVLVAMLYTHTDALFVAALMRGARAGGVAVFVGAAVRLIRPQLAARPIIGAALTVSLVLVVALSSVGVFPLLLVAGAVGAVALRP
jgi:chromate transport protein ChrA